MNSLITRAMERRADFYIEIQHPHGVWSGYARNQVELDLWIANAKARGETIIKTGKEA